MIIVRVELHSAISGKITELARMQICNVGGTLTRRNYAGQTFIGRSKESLDRHTVSKTANIENHPSLDVHVWNLVTKMLTAMGYTR